MCPQSFDHLVAKMPKNTDNDIIQKLHTQNKNKSGTKEANNEMNMFIRHNEQTLKDEKVMEMLGLECSTVCSRDVDVDAERQKRKRLEASEMWIWRRMEKLGWTAIYEIVKDRMTDYY